MNVITNYKTIIITKKHEHKENTKKAKMRKGI